MLRLHLHQPALPQDLRRPQFLAGRIIVSMLVVFTADNDAVSPIHMIRVGNIVMIAYLKRCDIYIRQLTDANTSS